MTGETIMKIMMKNIRYIFVLTLALLTWESAWGGSKTDFYSHMFMGSSGNGQVYMVRNTSDTKPNVDESKWTTKAFIGAQAWGSDVWVPENLSGQPSYRYHCYVKANNGFRFLGFSTTEGNTEKGVGSVAGKGTAQYYIKFTHSGNKSTKSDCPAGLGTSPKKGTLWCTFGVPTVVSCNASALGTVTDGVININLNAPTTTNTVLGNINYEFTKSIEAADFSVPTVKKIGDVVQSNDFIVGNLVYTATSSAEPPAGSGTVQVSYGPINRHGVQSVEVIVQSKYDGGTGTYSQKTVTIILDADFTPSFDRKVESVDFGSAAVGGDPVTKTIDNFVSNLNTTAESATWSAEFTGDDASSFSIASNGTVSFVPQKAGVNSATMVLKATYRDGANQDIYSVTQTYTLTGTGAAGADPIIVTATDAATAGGVESVLGGFSMPDVVGTSQGSFVFDVENAATPTVTFTGEGAEYFSYEYNAVAKKLTIRIQSTEDPVEDIDYDVTMSISGGYSSSLKGSIKTKKASTLVLLSNPLEIYTNTVNYVPVKGGSGERIYITLDPDPNDFVSTDGEKLSGKAVSTSPVHVTITQAASATMKGASLQTDVNVIRHTPLITLTPGQVVYPHQSYAGFVTSDNTEATLSATLTSSDATLTDNTLAVGAPESLPATLILHVEQDATTNYNAVDRDIPVYVVKNPAHVPVTMSEGLFNNSVPQTLGDESRETLLENFVVASNDVQWTGSEWNGSAYTGTPWTSVGNTNQFTLTATGGSVTYHFAGVPDVITFTLAYRGGSSSGTLKLEESANGSSWTTVRSYSSPAAISEYLKQDTRYLRFTYTGTDICSVQGLNITEANYLRLSEHYVDYMQADDGTYADQQVAFSAANWGNVSVEVSSAAFEADVTFDDASRDYDIYSAGSLNIRHVGTGGEAAWVKIMQGERLLDAVRVTALPRYISATTADVIYTGADLRVDAEDATIAERQRMFEHTFDNEGNPLFTTLYVFGVSRNTDNVMVTENGIPYYKLNAATESAGSNYKIPCYIYTRNGGRYEWNKKTIENMNTSTKSADFKLTGADGQKLYFTGTCDYASTGYTSAADGAFHVTGTSNKRVDIYLERCSISSRSKMQSGKTNGGVKTFDSYYTTDLPQGAGGVFVFECTDTYSTGFSPYVHIRDYNYLKSVEGIPHNSGGDWQWGAAIEVKVSNLSSHTNLTLDDLWPVSATESVHTNGQLDFSTRSAWSRSINIGSANTVLTFNGGYYRFAPINAAATGSSYNNFMPVAYSAFGGKTYGIGEEQVGGTVVINDGTFGLTGSIPSDNSTHTCDDSPYKTNSAHLRFPENTTVNGGSFLLPLVACGSSTEYPGQTINNRYGDNLVEEAIESTGTTADGVALITMSEAINQYYLAKADEQGYGMQSIRAKGDGTVVTMLPASVLGVDDLRGYNNYPWLFSAPAMQGQMNAFVKAQVSMNQNAPSGPKDAIQNFLHIEIDDYTREQFKNFEPATTAGVTISVNGSDNYSSITNTEDYTIRKAITMMIPIVADHWYTFTAPFDINTVSILEILPEDDLVETADNDLDEALEQQGHAMVDFMAYLVKNVYSGSFTIPMYGTFKFQSKSYTFRQLFDQYKTSVGATIEPLKAFKNQNDWDANYFLYEPSTDGTTRSDYWTVSNGNLVVNWIPALPEIENEGEPNEQTYVMRRGRTYAMQFPYCPGCEAAINDQWEKELIDHPYEKEWDYWTGKYLVLEGVGPQTIWGTNNELLTNMLTPQSGKALFSGNATFAKRTITDSHLYYHNEVDGKFHDYFLQSKSSYDAKPGQGFLLVNPAGGSAAPVRSYPFSAPNTGSTIDTTTGIPTIGQSEYRALNPTGSSAVKVLIDGQLYILRDNKLFDIHGREIMSE